MMLLQYDNLHYFRHVTIYLQSEMYKMLLFFRYMPHVSWMSAVPVSLPTVGSALKIIKCPDEQGIERSHPVDDATLNCV